MKVQVESQLVAPIDDESIALIAEWYFNEWRIPVDTTIEKIKKLLPDGDEFQVLLTVNGKPVATGGIYTHVGLLSKEPQFKVYKNWLGLVYTKPESRGLGFGTLLCNRIQEHSKYLGLKHIYLFTYTAENLYRRLGWQMLERLVLDNKDIVVMKMSL